MLLWTDTKLCAEEDSDSALRHDFSSVVLFLPSLAEDEHGVFGFFGHRASGGGWRGHSRLGKLFHMYQSTFTTFTQLISALQAVIQLASGSFADLAAPVWAVKEGQVPPSWHYSTPFNFICVDLLTNVHCHKADLKTYQNSGY